MTKYPLKVRVYEAGLDQPQPSSRIAEYTVKARRANDDEHGEFFIIDPMNGNEIGAYESLEAGTSTHDTGSFYWIDEIINEEE